LVGGCSLSFSSLNDISRAKAARPEASGRTARTLSKKNKDRKEKVRSQEMRAGAHD
jgi:hypothetical protein